MADFSIWSLADFGETNLFNFFNNTYTVTGTPDVLSMSDDDDSFDDFFGNGGQTQDPGMNQILTSDLVVDGVTLGSVGDGVYNAAEGVITNLTTGETGRVIYITVNGGGVGDFVGVATTIQINPGDDVQTSNLTPLATEDYTDIIACFTPGTLIRTAVGDRPIETLRPGDPVWTLDNGFQPVRWVGRTHLSALHLAARPELRPIRFERASLGANAPARDMLLSPNHRVLRSDAAVMLNFGVEEALVPAKALTGRPDIGAVLPKSGVTYVHLMFDAHQVVSGDGVLSESFHPACLGQGTADDAARAELEELFPDLATYGPTARMVVRVQDAAVLRL